LKALHASIGAMDNGAAYFARAVSYGRKMFMKLTAGRKVLMHRHLVYAPADQKIWVAICSFRCNVVRGFVAATKQPLDLKT
jgi:hypothetical protein